MRKRYLILSAVVAVIVVYGLAGCSSKPKAQSQADHPASMEQTEQKVEEAKTAAEPEAGEEEPVAEKKVEATKPAVEPPASSKPKDHPAH